MSAITQYLINVDYRLRGVEDAVRKLDNAGAHAQKTERSFLSLRNVFMLGAGLYGVNRFVGGLINVNSEMQNMQIAMTAVVQSNFGGSMAAASKQADGLIDRMRTFAREAPGATQDYIRFAQGIMPAVTSRGGSLADVEELSKGGVVAAMVLGERADVASRDIMQSMMGPVSASRDRFAAMLIQPYMDLDQFNKMKVSERIKVLKQALTSPAIKDATKRYAGTWDAQVSTLKDHWRDFQRMAGRPIFDAAIKQLKRMNEWIDKNPEKIKKMAEDIGNALVKGGEALFSAGKFVAEKLGWIIDSLSQFSAAQIGSWWRGDRLNAEYENTNKIFHDYAAALEKRGISGPMAEAIAQGKIDFDPNSKLGHKIAESWREANAPQRQMAASRQLAGIVGSPIDKVSAAIGKGVGGYLSGWLGVPLKGRNGHGRNVDGRGGTMNVTIKKIEVVADDSDNFVHDLVGAVGREITSPAQGLNMPRSAW